MILLVDSTVSAERRENADRHDLVVRALSFRLGLEDTLETLRRVRNCWETCAPRHSTVRAAQVARTRA